ncbi:MAG: arylsulfatase [Nocardioidaceae bacterium]
MTDISRRRLLQGSGAVMAGLALEGCSGTSASTQPKRPNIVVILADDMGYSDLSCFGSEIPTPHIDSIGHGGRTFTQMTNNPMCCPSRAALLTGLYPTQTGVGYYTKNYGSPGYQGYLNGNCATIAEVLKQTGYRTAISGKWHVSGWHQKQSLPPARGFDEAFCEVGGNGYFTTERFLNGKMIGVSPKRNFYMTDAITGYAINRIQEFAKGPDPFFLYCAYTAPHWPLQAPADAIVPFHGHYKQGWTSTREKRYERLKQLGITDPRWQLSPPPVGVEPWDTAAAKDWEAARMEVYAAQVSVMDQGIGKILDTIKQQGLEQDTLVLYLSDNGASAEGIPQHEKQSVPTDNGKPMRSGNTPAVFPGASDTFSSYGEDWANVSATPFRRYKRWVEEGGICTPFLASWPGTLPSGGVDNRPLHVMDFMPTMVELAGATYPTTRQGSEVYPMEGESFANVLTNASNAADWDHNRRLFWEFEGHRAARQDGWKIVSDVPSGPFELYDMVEDRTETHNVAAQHPDIVKTLGTAWEDWKARVGVRTWRGLALNYHP